MGSELSLDHVVGCRSMVVPEEYSAELFALFAEEDDSPQGRVQANVVGGTQNSFGSRSTHYEFFASIGDGCSSAEDREHRLRHKERQNVCGKVGLRPGTGSSSRPEDLMGTSNSSASVLQDTMMSERSRSNGKSGKMRLEMTSNTSKEKTEMRTREACESLRFLVFGTEAQTRGLQQQQVAYEQSCGSKEEVVQLQKVWSEMDEDGSGDVEFQEFLSFFSRSKTDRLLGMRCVNYLVGKAKDEGIDEREMGCTVEDMMRLLWLKATDEDVSQMLHWFREAQFLQERVATPPLLPKRKQRAILENFPHLSFEGGKVGFSELVEHTRLDPDTMKGLRDLWAGPRATPELELSKQDLLEMLCPQGYRAHEGVRKAVSKNGTPLAFVHNHFFQGWLTAERAMAAEEMAAGATFVPG